MKHQETQGRNQVRLIKLIGLLRRIKIWNKDISFQIWDMMDYVEKYTKQTFK